MSARKIEGLGVENVGIAPEGDADSFTMVMVVSPGCRSNDCKPCGLKQSADS